MRIPKRCLPAHCELYWGVQSEGLVDQWDVVLMLDVVLMFAVVCLSDVACTLNVAGTLESVELTQRVAEKLTMVQLVKILQVLSLR